MATYYHGSSEIQADGLQTLYLMNPSYGGYSDTHQSGNMLFLNSAARALNPTSIPHAPPSQTQHFVGIPLSVPTSTIRSENSDDPTHQSTRQQHEIPALHDAVPRFQYNLWGSVDQTSAESQSLIPAAVAVRNSGGGVSDVANQMGFHRPVTSPVPKGLSLSLSPRQPAYRSLPADHNFQLQTPVGVMSPRSGDGTHGFGGSSSSVAAVSNGTFGMQSVILGSKYLKAAQQVLDEVINIGKGIDTESEEGRKEKEKMNRESMAVSGGEASSGSKTTMKRCAELTTGEKQDLQMKKAKLVSMVDEVERRYRQYHNQMQIVVTSFEQAAGLGSAKSYTALALQTISKQFRCLKDAISAQIKATSKSLGEDQEGEGNVDGSRLKYVDHQLRQQRALQQLGMVQQNAWRPQRGLPERAVSVLRAWLFEHFLHPYPKDSDKLILAKQTGLTRSQVSNWFINARVRLWKPMVEEMYLEETKEQQQNGSEENSSKTDINQESGFISTAPQEISTVQLDQINTLKSKQENPMNQNASPTEISTSTVASPNGGFFQAQAAGFGLTVSTNAEGVLKRSSKKPRSDVQSSPSSILSVDMDMKPETSKGIHQKFNSDSQTRDIYPLLAGTTNHGSGFGAYPIEEFERFTPDQWATRFQGNGVSLTLGLPHCDNLSLSGNTHQNYLSNHNLQLGSNRLQMETHYSPQVSHSSNGYDNINIQNKKRFDAQMLHDFVS